MSLSSPQCILISILSRVVLALRRVSRPVSRIFRRSWSPLRRLSTSILITVKLLASGANCHKTEVIGAEIVASALVVLSVARRR
ncbi:hypothetical protein BD626DRAFT_182126 [Schizophyllum amplum]|uniref:Secreted protein n=1 Tax=Schizophyllum amplum TaxID=97359 RepID=A0A550C1K7_9AGAR|nr:hypothetical protein BD626DRAFT_182126 [Auriculariopsis ampla]